MDYITIKGKRSERLTDGNLQRISPTGTFLIHLRNAGEECPRTRREKNQETVQQKRNITNMNKRSYHVVPLNFGGVYFTGQAVREKLCCSCFNLVIFR